MFSGVDIDMVFRSDISDSGSDNISVGGDRDHKFLDDI